MPPNRTTKGIALALLIAASPALTTAQPDLQLDPELRALADREAPAVLETLKQLTSVDSGTGQAAGMEAVASQIEKFAQALGGQVRRVKPAGNVVGPNLVITFPGKGQRKVMLMAHMDTVYLPGTAAQRPFRLDGRRAIAPGIADDKSGVAVFLHAMKLLKARGFDGCERVTLVFNSDEERGTFGSRDLIREQAAAHDVILSGEPTGETESVVLGTSGVAPLTARVRLAEPGAADARLIEEVADLVLRSRDTQRQIPDTRMNWTLLRAEDARPMQPAPADFRRATLVFRVKGRASHAGVSPQDGVNAVVELAALIGRVSEVAGRQSGWLWRWRQASGGQVSNVIPDQASATLEIFLPRGEEGERRLQALRRAADARLLPRAAVSHELLDGPPLGLRGSTEAWAGADTRVPNLPAFDLLKEQAAKGVTAARFPGLSISLDGQVTFLPFNANEEAKALAALASEINQGLGGKPLRLLPRTTGATDAAWAAQSGKPVLEGFGLPGGGYHTNDDEFILHETIPRRVTLAAEMVRSACRR